MSKQKQCATCRNTASANSDYCETCEQHIDNNKRIEELQRCIRSVTDLSALIQAVDFLLEQQKVLM
jgi:predicted amidophosphoribosyltransferase